MKKLFMLMIILTLIVSCQVEENNEEVIENENVSVDIKRSKNFNGEYPNNEIVVQYDPLLSEPQRQEIRNLNNVYSFKKCECADPTLELWQFQVDDNGYNSGGLQIEEVVLGNKDNSGLEGIELNNFIEHTGEKLGITFGVEDVSVGLTKQVASNSDLTIAILDTGVDYNYFGFTQPFLFNTIANGTSCTDNGFQDVFGWDFVNQDNDPFDDVGHGTVVSSFIYEKLMFENINFQILPIKVFDASGRGKYFDILCGFKYALNNSAVDVINMSFGWYNNTSTELLDRFMEESQGKVLLTASAGNINQNNDEIPHFPSSYPIRNLMSVATLSSNPSTIELADFSNFGVNSVDIAAIGQDIPFQIAPNEYLFVSGTSYSSAYTAAYAGTLFDTESTPEKWISNIIESATQTSNLSMLKYQAYID